MKPTASPRNTWPLAAAAVALSAAGGSAATALGVPAGMLIGGMMTASLAAALGLRIWMPDWLRDIAFVMVGLTMGGAVARESLALIAQWPITMLTLAFELIFLVFATSYMFRRLLRLDVSTAYLSAFPGHLSMVIGLAAAGIGDAGKVAVLQVSRVMVMSIVGPLAAAFFPVLPPPPGTVLVAMAMPTLIGVTLACLVVGYLFNRLRVPAAFVLGAMLVATSARLSGLFEGTLPDFVPATAFILIGALMGTRIAGISVRDLRHSALGGLLAAILSFTVVTAMALLASLVVDAPFPQIWIAIMPGGLEVMGALGVALGYDTAFIAAHHVLRILLLSVAIPLFVMVLVRRRDAAKDGHNVAP